MVERFLCLQAFVRVAETQNFSNAARQLGLCPSVVSSRIKQLEKYVQASLFHRSTRMVVLSEVGHAVFEECADLVTRMELVTDRMRLAHGSLAGTLRIQVLPGFASGHFGRALKDFCDTYPDISLDVVVSDKMVNPAEEACDVVFQIFRSRAENVIERALFPVRRIFCASPDYLEKHGTPFLPAELAAHELGLYSGNPTRHRLIFRDAGGEETAVDLVAKLRSNSVHLLHDFARSGSGISCLPTLVCGDDLINSVLVPLLPRYELHPQLELRATYPTTHRGALKVKLLVDFFARRFADDLPWDRALNDLDPDRSVA